VDSSPGLAGPNVQVSTQAGQLQLESGLPRKQTSDVIWTPETAQQTEDHK